MPAISVIVPVYKVEKYIHRCVDSILGQTFTDFELILVDDGSPDNCGAICDEYAAKDSRIAVIHQENGGLSAARNAGIDWAFANSDSQWLSFIDSDDWVHPQYLEQLHQAAMSQHCELAVCGFAKVDKQTPFKDTTAKRSTCDTEEYFINQTSNAVPACGKLYLKEHFCNIRYPIGRLHEDEFITYKLIFRSNKIAVVDGELYYYFFNATGITQSEWSPKRLDALDACEERIGYFQTHNNPTMVRHSIIMLLSYIYLAQSKIDLCHDPKQRKTYTVLLKRHVRKILMRHKDIAVSDMAGIYEFAYPIEMQIYWYTKAFLRKLRLEKWK